MAGSCNFLMQESCYPGRSGHNVPVNHHQDKGYSLFCNFLSLYEWKSVNTFKGPVWEAEPCKWVGLCISGCRQHSFTKGAD